MLTALDLLNRFLGYFNIDDKPKGRAFTIVAFIANFYLLYVALRNMRFANYRVIGILFLLAFIILEYFVVVNFYYYFTDRRFKFDISPKVAKLLGSNQAEVKAAKEKLQQNQPLGASNGLFKDEKLLPAAIATGPVEEAELKHLVAELTASGRLALDYSGLDDHALKQLISQTHQPVLAIGRPLELPYFDLEAEGRSLFVVGGVNALHKKRLGRIEQVGLMPTRAAQKDYQLAAAHVYLTGGESKQLGRSGLVVQHAPYKLVVQLAYTPKNQPPKASVDEVKPESPLRQAPPEHIEGARERRRQESMKN